jgi:hypothetical protein
MFKWSILNNEKEGLSINVYSSIGRQPVHFDNGSHWLQLPGGRAAPVLAVILMLDDGYSTYVSGSPIDGYFPSLVKVTDGDTHKMFQVLKETLHKGDREYTLPPLCRAGQVLFFHPGEQPHCGIGHEKYVSLLTGSPNRKTLFLELCPTELVTMVAKDPIFGSENQTWGLMNQEWSEDRVDSSPPNPNPHFVTRVTDMHTQSEL